MPDGLRPPYDIGDGRTCSDMLGALPLVEYRFRRAGWIQQDFAGMVMQWSGRSDVSASAATHKSGAVFDVAAPLVNTDAKLTVWQECGFTPFHRFPPKFSAHGHVLVNGCPHLHGSAAAQILSYRRGMDGLASESPYPGPTDVPYRTWQRAQVIYADLIEELQMSAGDVWSYDLGDKDAGFYVKSTRESTLIIGRRTQQIVDDLAELTAAVASLAATSKATSAQLKKLLDAQAEQRAELSEMVQPALDAGAANAPLPTPSEE